MDVSLLLLRSGAYSDRYYLFHDSQEKKVKYGADGCLHVSLGRP